MAPRLKSLTCLSGERELLVSLDPKVRIRLADADGRVLALLQLLREGSRDPAELTADLQADWPGTSRDDVMAAIASLDQLGWLETTRGDGNFSEHEQQRYASNLAFFDAFSTLSRSAQDIQTQLRAAHVLVLGAGGLGSAVLMNLAGLGIGAVTVVDSDQVELRNFARQFTYVPSDIGKSKADRVAHWLREFDPSLTVNSVHRRIGSAADITELLNTQNSGGPIDFVVSAIDEPDDIDQWVNRACVAAGIPFARGGLAYTQGLYWSVAPGSSACRECLERHRSRLAEGPDRETVSWPRVIRQDRVNRAIGPVAGLLGAVLAMEALRYLTDLVPPVSAGRYQLINFAADCGTSADPWPADPECPVCATAPTRRLPASPVERGAGSA